MQVLRKKDIHFNVNLLLFVVIICHLSLLNILIEYDIFHLRILKDYTLWIEIWFMVTHYRFRIAVAEKKFYKCWFKSEKCISYGSFNEKKIMCMGRLVTGKRLLYIFNHGYSMSSYINQPFLPFLFFSGVILFAVYLSKEADGG